MNGSLYDPYEQELISATERNRARSSALRGKPLTSTPSSGVEMPKPGQTGAYDQEQFAPQDVGLTPSSAPPAQADYRSQALRLMKEAMELGEPREEDTQRLVNFAKEREATANRNLVAGMILQTMGGSAFAPAGEMIMRRALASQEPLKFAGGMIEGGQYIADPEAGR